MMPDIRIATQIINAEPREVAYWHETTGKEHDGSPQVWQLTSSQFESHKLLKTAGDKQVLTFLSGEGEKNPASYSPTG